MTPDGEYLTLLRHIMDHGNDKGDRTGTGTRSVFGYQMRFDLKDSFPLLTTKKVHFKSIVHELLWFISGDTNIKYLKENGVSIWDEWADKDGNLGPVYGHQWREWSGVDFVEPRVFDKPSGQKCEGYEPSIFGVANIGDRSVYIGDSMHKPLYQTWFAMIRRCYDENHTAYDNYGGRGIFVDTRWLLFSNFFQDVKKLENWLLKLEYPNEYSLDKDFYMSNMYGSETCKWASKIEQSVNTRNTKNAFVAVDESGNKTLEYGLKPFCKKYNISSPLAAHVLDGKYKKAKGFQLDKIESSEAVPRLSVKDQLAETIALIKHNPDSRRIIVSAWNPPELPRMSLSPCHCLFQFYVHDNKLSCQLYQRSCDVFLGVPFNIASYALLTCLVAHVCDMEPDEFIWTGGDTHIYNNHFEQVKEQLSRKPYPSPKLRINKEVKSLFDVKYDDIELLDYQYHPTIKAPIAV